jgi:hypothetical protein
MVLWLWSIWQLVQFLGKYINIFIFILICLNDLKLGIKNYHLLLWLIVINNDSIFNDDDVTCHVLIRCLQLIINFMTHDINFNKIAFIDWSKMFIMPKHIFMTCPMQLQCLTQLGENMNRGIIWTITHVIILDYIQM